MPMRRVIKYAIAGIFGGIVGFGLGGLIGGVLIENSSIYAGSEGSRLYYNLSGSTGYEWIMVVVVLVIFAIFHTMMIQQEEANRR